MKITITEKMATLIGKEKFIPFGLQKDAWNWRQKGEIDLSQLSTEEIERFKKVFLDVKQKSDPEDQRRIRIILRSISAWLGAITGSAGQQKAKNGESFQKLLKLYLKDAPGHRIYKEEEGIRYFYYVNEIRYVYPDKYDREHVNMNIIWEELGGIHQHTESFYEESFRGFTVVGALAKKGYLIETQESREAYLSEIKRFSELSPKIGSQFWAHGTASDDMDGNPEGDGDRWYWKQTHTLQMEREGEPTRVAIDVFYEEDSSERAEKSINIQRWFWQARDEDDEEEEEKVPPPVEVPIHPMLAIFDFKKHLRLRIHVNYLHEYTYDEKIGDRLILPSELKNLVEMLVEHRGTNFQDIVRGKSGGAVVLLTGPPGVGKTLTAEVFAETEKRALYSVQCSQLGVTPNELEGELLKVFARCRRWGAVLLLDEADVYVRQRGSDLNQNAIVGVFLRVLEYQSSILFLTTNRPEDVDDAIASRCIARIDYPVPTSEQQMKIWEVLSASSKIELSRKTIEKIVQSSPGITGRDVKNLLKLANLISLSKGEKITEKSVDFVKKFKPTITAREKLK